MAERELLMVFCYDVAKDRVRERVADLLESELARVQRSVFEGRMTAAAAERLGRRVNALMEEGDSLRVYAVTPVGLKHSRAFDKLGLAAPQDYWLV
jgi:CRISPR-associated protein Cas2